MFRDELKSKIPEDLWLKGYHQIKESDRPGTLSEVNNDYYGTIKM
jgi:hypothetical protein